MPNVSVPPPQRFRAAAPVSAPPFSERGFVANFGSPELSRLVDEAVQNNNDIAAAVSRIAQADATARVNSAPLFPLLALNSSAQRVQTPGTAVPPSQLMGATTAATALAQQNAATTRTNMFKLGLNASYELDFWGKNEDASKAARLLANASRFDRSVVEISTVSAVMNAYFQVLNAQDRLRIAHENVKIADGVLKALEIRLSVGTGTILDVSQQATVLSTQRAAIPQLEETLIQQKNTLAVLLGRAPEALDTTTGSLARLHPPAIAPGLPSEVLLRRPDVAAAEAKLASQEFSVFQARAAFFPSITLTGQYGLQSIVLKNLLRPEAIAWEVLGNAMQPLFDGDNLHSQYLLQQGKFAELAANYKKQVLTALADTENALTALHKSWERMRFQAEAVSHARRAMEAAQARLRAGTIDIITLSTTETTYFQNQDTLEQVRLAWFQAAASLYQALGGGWSPTTRDQQIAMATHAFAADRGPWP